MLTSLYPGIHFYTRNPKGIIKRYKRQARQEHARVEDGLQHLRDRIAQLEARQGIDTNESLQELRHQYSYYTKGRKTDVIQLLEPNCLSTYAYVPPNKNMQKLVCDLSMRHHCPVLMTNFQFFSPNIIVAAAADGRLITYGNQKQVDQVEGMDSLFEQLAMPFQKPPPFKNGQFISWFEQTFGVQFFVSSNFTAQYKLSEVCHDYRLFKPKRDSKSIISA